jgi:hypothetical protein
MSGSLKKIWELAVPKNQNGDGTILEKLRLRKNRTKRNI